MKEELTKEELIIAINRLKKDIIEKQQELISLQNELDEINGVKYDIEPEINE